jgi:hypothetical protein
MKRRTLEPALPSERGRNSLNATITSEEIRQDQFRILRNKQGISR